MPLPSGLPNEVGDDEDIARFLTQSGHYSTSSVKPSAFLPNPKNGETSVFRHGAEPQEDLKKIADESVGELRKVHGAAILKAADIREALLQIDAIEPPPRHANIIGWPWLENDRAFGKAQQKELAALLAQKTKGPLRFE